MIKAPMSGLRVRGSERLQCPFVLASMSRIHAQVFGQIEAYLWPRRPTLLRNYLPIYLSIDR